MYLHRTTAIRFRIGLLLVVGFGIGLVGCAGERPGEGEAEGEPAQMETAEMETRGASAGRLAVARVVEDVRTPESVHVGPDGRYYVSEIGEFGGDGDGRIRVYDPTSWESTVLASGLNDPKGLDFAGSDLYVTDRDRVVKVTADGSTSVLAGPDAFPQAPTFLNDLVVGPDGAVYVSDSGDFQAADGAVYRIDMNGQVEPVITQEGSPEIASPNGLTFDPAGDLLIVDLQTGKLLRLTDGGIEVVADGLGGGDGLEFHPDGTLYITDVRNGRVFRITFTTGAADVEQAAEVTSAADLGLDSERGALLIPQLGENTITVLEIG